MTCFFCYSQNRKGQLNLIPSTFPYQLYVSFESNSALENSNFDIAFINAIAAYEIIAKQYEIQLKKGISISEEKLGEMEANALKYSENAIAVKNLRSIFLVTIENPTNERLLEVGIALEKLNSVKYCCLTSLEPVKPPVDIPPTTMNFEPNQSYIQSNPGLNMQYAWNLGLNGQGIKLRDVEYGFNKNHEELASINTTIAPGMTISSSASNDFTEHGTSVFGILFSHKGTYGISGLSYGSQELILYPEWQQVGYNRINAVTLSIANSTAGDLIVYEMQTNGVGPGTTNFVCAEYDQVVWDLTKAATDSGIVIVAAAGNGNQNLDNFAYSSYMNRGNSGAIIVGGGTATTSHNRIFYSTFGSRVDVQAWAEDVRTIGRIGSFTLINNDFNQSYTNFSGTSSATALVSACASVLQSYHHSLAGNYLSSSQLRTILKETGIAQGTSVIGNVGPIPNMQTAIQRVYSDFLLKTNDTNLLKFSIYPVPTKNELFFVKNDFIANDSTVEIINSVGQIVFASAFPEAQKMDVSTLSSGFYFVKVSQGKNSFTQKFIKQ